MHLNERGFAVGAILLAVVLMSVVAAAMVLGNRGPSGSAGDHASKVNAATIIQQGTNLRMGFDVMQARGIAPASVTFDATANTGLFNPNAGGAQPQTAPASAQTTVAAWAYHSAKIVGVGTTAGVDYVVALGKLRDTVCTQINLALYNSATIPASGVASAAWTTGSTLDLSAGVTGIDNRPEGCVSTTGGTDDNVYYTVTAAQ
jgi:hypothetical protein